MPTAENLVKAPKFNSLEALVQTIEDRLRRAQAVDLGRCLCIRKPGMICKRHEAIAAALDAVRAEERAKRDRDVAGAQQAAVEIGEAAWKERVGDYVIRPTSCSCGGDTAWLRVQPTGAYEMVGCICHTFSERAVAEERARADAVVKAAEAIEVLFKRPDESANDHFERRAEQFRRDTGILAPGKDQATLGSRHTDTERQAAYAAWNQALITRYHTALADWRREAR